MDSTFFSNTAGGGSGGAININAGTVTVDRSAFRGNTASATGGAIRNNGLLIVNASSFGHNLGAQGGGGILNGNVMTLTASTVSSNTVTGAFFVGGGLYNASGVTMHISRVTVSDNAAYGGGGIYNAGALTIEGSVVSANSGNNCFDQGATFTSGGYNVSSDASCSTPFTNTNDRNNAGAQTQPLQANGAAPLLPGSVAINNVTAAGLCAAPDQLGRSRLPAPCDAGALEYGVYAVTPSAGPNGSISPNTLQTVIHGGTTSFALTPNTGYHIATVTGCGGSLSSNTYTTGAITDDCTVNATFAINRYALTTATIGTGSGSIILNPAGGTYDHGTVVTATANAAASANFTGWSGTCTGTGTCNVTMDAPKAVTATFTLKTYTITPTAGAGGAITPDTPQVVNYGGTQAFTIAANPGYRIVDVGVDGVAQGALSSYTFTNVQANHTISATFACGGVITVQNTADSGAGSLRQAAADACPGATIAFAPALAGQTITFTSQIVLNKNLTISGTVPITLSGNNATRIIEVSAGANVTLYGLTLRNGSADQGGAIRNFGTVMINNSILHGNSAVSEGGAIYIGTGGTLTVNNSTFRSNVAGNGGGILSRGVLAVSHSTFGANTATWGAGMAGAILTAEAATVDNSTFSANSAYFGGAIVNTKTASVSNSTFTGNTAAQGGAIFNNYSTSTVSASVFSANSGGNCLGAFISGGYNVSSDATCPFAGRNDITNAMTQTLSLQPNGTTPLLASSLAINNVTDPALCAGTDQLGNPRPFPCSAGAVEFITAATTRYVAPTGNDTGNTCLNAAAPCATLARALEQAVDNNTIRVITGTYLVASQPISKSVLILGAGSGQTILQANATAAKHSNGRVLGVAPGRNVTLAGLTVRHGWSSGANFSGGGIANVGVLTVRDSAILSNTVENGGGGGIYNVVDTNTPGSGVLMVYNSTLAGNRVFYREAPAAGAAAAAGTLPGVAGLLGFVTVMGVTWKVGRKQPGRAWMRRLPPLLFGALFLSNCTCGADPQGLGGALFNGREATAILRFATLANNQAEAGGGGGIYSVVAMDLGDIKLPGATTIIGSSVLSQNSGGDCGGKPVNSQGGNVVSDRSCGLGGAGDVNEAGNQVTPVQANGVAPLLSASAAIDRVTSACLTADQVGAPRPALCDAGAAEFTGTAEARLQTTLRGSPERPYQGQTVVYTATVRSIGAAPATNVGVTIAVPTGLTFQSMTQADGPACTINSNTATCATVARESQVTLVAQATVATADVGSQLNTTVTAQATNSTQVSTPFLVITRAVPPPSVGCGGDYATIQAAVNAVSADSVIEVCPGTYKENITINKNLTIRSRAGAATTIVDGSQTGRVFEIQSSAVVTLAGLTIQQGKVDGIDGYGGGIRNEGTLTLNNSILSGNSAQYGGGINNNGTLTINNSTFSRSRAEIWGGGIYNQGTLTVNNSTFSQSRAEIWGGGIYNQGTLVINSSTFSGNWAKNSGGGVYNWREGSSTLVVNNSTFNGNSAHSGGGLINWSWSAVNTVNNSIFSGNTAPSAGNGLYNLGHLTVNNSVLQDPGPTGNGNQVNVADAGFVNSQQGNLHLTAGSPALGMGYNCPATDLEGLARPANGCSAGAYEFSTATAAVRLAQAQLEPKAAATTFAFTSFDGAVTLDIPAGAVTQTVVLAFNLGRPTGGGRAQGVVFTPYDAANQPLPANFTFAKPLTLVLAYDPALVTSGLEVDLRPMRFEPATGGWLPFTTDVGVDKVARTVTFPIQQAGEYGLFTLSPGVYASLTAASPAGVHYLDGGATVLYTLAALNGDSQLRSALALRHVLPAGLTFVAWVDDGSAAGSGAVYAGGVITWQLPSLAGGGLRYASFNAQVSADAAFWGQFITSTATLTDAAGLNLAAQAVVSVNGPTTPVDYSVTTRPGEMAMLWPLLNDLNPDGSPLVLAALGSPAHGVATIVGDTVLYTPTAGFEGNDSFSYTVHDGQFSAQGQIQVRVARLAFLSVFKTVAYNGQEGVFLADVPQGSEVVYTLDIANGSGGEVAVNAVLTDVLPAGVAFTGWITQSGATLDGATIRWSAASLPTQAVTTIRFRATVVGAVGSTVANNVQVAAANADPTQSEASFVVAGPLAPQPLYLPLIQRAATTTASDIASALPPIETPFLEATPVPTDEVEPESPPTETPVAEALPVPTDEVEPESPPTETPVAEALPVPADETEPTPTETPVAEASPVPTAAAGQSAADQLPFVSFLPLLQQ